MGRKLRQYIIPFLKLTIYLYFGRRGKFSGLRHPLKSADIGNHLVIIIISMPALHGFNIPAVFLVVLIRKSIVLLLPFFISSRNPFVPAGNENQFGIQFQSPLPLLLKIEALVNRGRIRGMPVFVSITSSKRSRGIHGGKPSFFRPVLGNADCYLLESPLRRLHKPMLGSHLQPSPMVRACGALVVDRLSWTKGKELSHLPMKSGGFLISSNVVQTFWISHNQRLSFPFKPYNLVKSRLIEILIDFLHRLKSSIGR